MLVNVHLIFGCQIRFVFADFPDPSIGFRLSFFPANCFHLFYNEEQRLWQSRSTNYPARAKVFLTRLDKVKDSRRTLLQMLSCFAAQPNFVVLRLLALSPAEFDWIKR